MIGLRVKDHKFPPGSACVLPPLAGSLAHHFIGPMRGGDETCNVMRGLGTSTSTSTRGVTGEY